MAGVADIVFQGFLDLPFPIKYLVFLIIATLPNGAESLGLPIVTGLLDPIVKTIFGTALGITVDWTLFVVFLWILGIFYYVMYFMGIFGNIMGSGNK